MISTKALGGIAIEGKGDDVTEEERSRWGRIVADATRSGDGRSIEAGAGTILAADAELERLRSEVESTRRDAGAILARLRARKGTDGAGRLSVSDLVAILKIAGKWPSDFQAECLR